MSVIQFSFGELQWHSCMYNVHVAPWAICCWFETHAIITCFSTSWLYRNTESLWESEILASFALFFRIVFYEATYIHWVNHHITFLDFTWSNVLNILHGLRLTDTGTFSFNTHFHIYSWNIWYEHCIASMGINLLRLMKFIISWLPFGHLHYTAQYPSTMYILSFSDFQISPSSWLPKISLVFSDIFIEEKWYWS